MVAQSMVERPDLSRTAPRCHKKSAGRPEAAGFFVSEMSPDVADAFLLTRLFVGLRLRRQLQNRRSLAFAQ